MKDQDGQSIQYRDGFAWGITPEGRTICLGTEQNIRDILAHPKKRPENPTIAEVISIERQLLRQDTEKAVRKQERERAKLAERKKLARKDARNFEKTQINKNRA